MFNGAYLFIIFKTGRYISLFIYYLFNDALKIYSLVENHYIDYKRISNNDLFIIYIERIS